MSSSRAGYHRVTDSHAPVPNVHIQEEVSSSTSSQTSSSPAPSPTSSPDLLHDEQVSVSLQNIPPTTALLNKTNSNSHHHLTQTSTSSRSGSSPHSSYQHDEDVDVDDDDDEHHAVVPYPTVGVAPAQDGIKLADAVAATPSKPLKDKFGRLIVLGQASLAACTAAMANTILGAGMLGLPHAFAESGYILGVFLLCLFGGFAAFALHLLACCAKTLNSPPATFYSVAQAAVPSATMLIDLAVAVKCFGVGTSFLIVVGDLIPEAVRGLFGIHDNTFFGDRKFWILVIVFCIVLPLSCLRSLNALRFTATFSIGFVCFLASVVFLYGAIPGTFNPCSGEDNTACRGETNLVRFNFNTMKVLSIFIFGFTCHQNIFSVCNEIRNFTVRRVNYVIGGSIGLAWCVYMVIAIFGYHTYGNSVSANVLKSYPNQILTNIVRLLVGLNCSFTYPLQCHPCRQSIISLYYSFKNRKNGTGTNKTSSPQASQTAISILTFLIVSASLGIALVVTDLGVVQAVVGATGSTTISYILPGLCYVKLHPVWDAKRYAAAFMLGLGICIIPFCLTFIFLK